MKINTKKVDSKSIKCVLSFKKDLSQFTSEIFA